MLNFPAIPEMMILDKIRKNDLQGWEELYDSYAAFMLSIICKLTGEKKKGEQLLIALFTDPKFEEYLCTVSSRLGFHVCTYAFSFAQRALKKEGIEPGGLVVSRLPKILQIIYQKNKLEETPARPAPAIAVYRSVQSYKWLPVFGINIYA